MPAQKDIIYVYRKAGKGGGEPRLVAAAAPCDGNLSPYLPEGSPLLMSLARSRVRALTRKDGIRRTVLLCRLAKAPDPRGDIDLPTLRARLARRGFRPLKEGGDKGADAYACTPGDILRALSGTEPPAETIETPKHRREGSAARRDTGRPGHPAADALDWKEATSLIERLRDDGRTRDALLVSSGCHLGLRISDLLLLRWRDLTEGETFSMQERKTGKTRKMKVNPKLRELALQAMEESGEDRPDALAFQSWAREDGQPITRQRAGQILKEAAARYGVASAKVFSTHSLRKTFGRRVWLQECRKGRGEQALLLLCDVFGHSSIQITKRYLGIRQDEILSVYDNL